MYHIQNRHSMHTHCFTCHQERKNFCRLCRPSGFKEDTGVVQLKISSENILEVIEQNEIEQLPYENKLLKNYHENPFTANDNRILVWESKRPKLDFNLCLVIKMDSILIYL